MKTNTTDYVSYPIALALKKAGFNELTNSFYDEAFVRQGEFEIVPTYAKFNEVCRTPGCECVSAPTLWQAQKWLREKKRIAIVVTPETDMADFNDIPKEFLTGEWCYEIWVDDDTHRYGMESHSSYEQALSAGIAAALELIEKKGE